MLRYVSLFTVTACLLLACGESQVVSIPTVDPGPQGNGMISGTVLREDCERIAGVWAGIDGTNLFAHTDSGGRFTLFGVPAGDYRLRLSAPESDVQIELYRDTTYLIRVGPGDTLRLDSMLLPVTKRWYCGYYPADQGRWLTSYTLLDARDMTVDSVQPESWGPTPGEITQLHTDLDSFYFAANPTVPNAGILAWHNGAPVSEVSPTKGRGGSILGPIVRAGDDTLRIRRENDSLCDLVFVFADSVPRAATLANRVLITTGSTSIIRGYRTDGNLINYVYGADTMCVRFAETQRVDWDICLVNDRTGDSCYWGNREVTWGAVFDGDNCTSDTLQSTPGALCEYVTPDLIRGMDLEDGSYSVYVRYFDGPSDSVTATPRLCIGLGFSGNFALVDELFFASPLRPMTKGEVWSAGKFCLPELRYVPGTEILTATPKALARSRVKERLP